MNHIKRIIVGVAITIGAVTVGASQASALPLCRLKVEGGRSYASCVDFSPGDRARVVRVCQTSAGTRRAFYGNTLSSAGASVTQCYAPYYYYVFTTAERWNIA